MAVKIPFVKMHGAGNDFVFLDRSQLRTPVTSRTARILLDRHFGIGGDQLLVLDSLRPGRDPRLIIYNADGSQAEMCGNGVRAVAAYLRDEKGFKKDFTILTKGGPKRILHRDGFLAVDMGEPILEGARIPVLKSGPSFNYPLRVRGKRFLIHSVSMGNPHCVIFVPDVNKFPVQTWGPLIETHPFFPRRVNVEFVEVVKPNLVRARVWERGAGETLACGTGACAIAVAGARARKTGRQLQIDLPGGRLGVVWTLDNHVFLTGPTKVSFEGNFLLNP